MGFIKSIFFAFVITSVSAFYGYTVEGGSVEVGKASTDSVVSSSVLILFSDVLLTQLLSLMIEVKSLYKSFEDKEVLKDINSVFENGKTNLIIGQSGSGKTVLMKCIVGLFRPTSGEVLYDGRDLVTMNKQEWKMLRREMGMIFQSAALFDSMTVLENVMFPLDMFSKDSYAEQVKRAQFCLDRVNLLEAQKEVPRRNQRRYAKACSHCKSHRPQPQIPVLR